jgi:hypothetical protein
MMNVEWCGWSISTPIPSVEQGEWNISPLSCSLEFVISKPLKLYAKEHQEANTKIQDEKRGAP